MPEPTEEEARALLRAHWAWTRPRVVDRLPSYDFFNFVVADENAEPARSDSASRSETTERRWVLKVMPTPADAATEARRELQVRCEAMTHADTVLADHRDDPCVPLVPRPQPTTSGSLFAEHTVDADGAAAAGNTAVVVFATLVPFLEGELLASVLRARTPARAVSDAETRAGGLALDPASLERIGWSLATLDAALASFTPSDARGSSSREDPVPLPPRKWDLANALERRVHLHHLAPASTRRRVAGALDDFETSVRPVLASLPRQWIHGDGNDYNVLVQRLSAEEATRIHPLHSDGSSASLFSVANPWASSSSSSSSSTSSPSSPHSSSSRTSSESPASSWVVRAWVDFDDLGRSYRVCDLAILATYLMMLAPDPLASLTWLARGFHAAAPLSRAELRVLLPLVRARLAVSLISSAEAAHRNPDNAAYLFVHAKLARSLLRRLERWPDAGVATHLVAACRNEWTHETHETHESHEAVECVHETAIEDGSRPASRGGPLTVDVQRHARHVARFLAQQPLKSLGPVMLFRIDANEDAPATTVPARASITPSSSSSSTSSPPTSSSSSSASGGELTEEDEVEFEARPVVFDFTAANARLTHVVGLDPAKIAAFTALLNDQVRAASAAVGLGRYDEDRVLYQSEHFVPASSDEEPRTVHLGVDLFAPAGTPVFAPFAGVVHSVAVNDNPLDYGPTVVLAHRIPPTTMREGEGARGDEGERTGGVESGGGEGGSGEFYTLYGHLAAESLAEGRLRVGDVVEQGALVGWLGRSTENGGWPPHVHFQVMTEPALGGWRGDYPGVCTRSRWPVFRFLTIDPNLVLRTETLGPAQMPPEEDV